MATALATRQPDDVHLQRTSCPGVYRRGSRYVAVYRLDDGQHKEAAATFEQARAIKLAREAQRRDRLAGPTLHGYALAWVEHHAGDGHDTVRQLTRDEYRRLLA